MMRQRRSSKRLCGRVPLWREPSEERVTYPLFYAQTKTTRLLLAYLLSAPRFATLPTSTRPPRRDCVARGLGHCRARAGGGAVGSRTGAGLHGRCCVFPRRLMENTTTPATPRDWRRCRSFRHALLDHYTRTGMLGMLGHAGRDAPPVATIWWSWSVISLTAAPAASPRAPSTSASS